VTIVEKTSKLLAKVRVSGGGRCNVTHACFEISALVKKYPRGTNLLKKAFHQFHTSTCINWFEDRGVKLKTEADGRMFSITDNSQTIIDCMLREANRYGVEILMNHEVKQLSKTNDAWLITFADDSKMVANYVCVACGGYPKGSMFKWLTDLGHTIEEPVPSLFTFNMPGNPITALMGVVAEKATVKIVGSKLSDEGP
jgi:predicted Rossmann fold flavoprotein